MSCRCGAVLSPFKATDRPTNMSRSQLHREAENRVVMFGGALFESSAICRDLEKPICFLPQKKFEHARGVESDLL